MPAYRSLFHLCQVDSALLRDYITTLKNMKTLPATSVLQTRVHRLDACTLRAFLFLSRFIGRIGDKATLGPSRSFAEIVITLGMLGTVSGSIVGAHVHMQQEAEDQMSLGSFFATLGIQTLRKQLRS